eukprot:jgi/Botrbrau1/14505/Bobra.0350s0010.1
MSNIGRRNFHLNDRDSTLGSAMAPCRTDHITFGVLLCLSSAMKVAADKALNQPNPSFTNPVEGLEATPDTTLTQQVGATLPVEDIQKLETYLHKALPSLHNPPNNEIASSASTDPVLELQRTPTNPMESHIPTDPAIPEPSTDRTNPEASVGELTTNPPANAFQQVTTTIAMNPVDDMWSGPGSTSLSPTPLFPFHNPLDDLNYIKAIKFPEEANLDGFCSRNSFTLNEAQDHAARLRAVRGTKLLGFQGAPYVPLAPWACIGKDPATEENVKRIPIPLERLSRTGVFANYTGQKAVPQYVIQFWGGPVTNPLRFYYIWYGSWPVGNKSPRDKTTVKILEDLAQSLGNSCIWSTTTTYTNANNVRITSALNFAGSIFVRKGSACYQGLDLEDSTVPAIADCLVKKGLVVHSPNTQYMVVASKEIGYLGFCTLWCGWHDYQAGYIIGYVQSAVECLESCSSQTHSPNNNVEADALANHIFHELTETATDPHIDAWLTRTQQENADLCAWTFGNLYNTPSPGEGQYNTRTTCPASAPNCVSRYWLLQQNWQNQPPDGVCGVGIYPPCNPMG